jgi:UDP-N-acetyl-2-amino-2-deoxyglucuronate dehydrogenase
MEAGMTSPQREYRFGIIGVGMISHFHARAIQGMRGGRLVAVASRSRAKADEFAKQYGVEALGTYRALVERDDIDVVNICTPSGAHLEPAVMAAQNGKHILCEKPLEVTLPRVDRMIEACRKQRVLLGGIFPSRTSEVYRRIKAAVEAGRLGRIALGSAYVKWWRPQTYYDSAAWRGTRKLDGGGCLMNQGIHTVDLLQWFMGPAVEVRAFTACLAHTRIEVEDTAVAAIRFRNGALGVIEGATSAWPGHAKKIELCGDRGSVATREDDLVAWTFAKPRKADAVLLERLGAHDTGKGGAADPKAISFVGHQRQFEDFVAALRAGRQPMVDGPEGRKAIELILAIYRSARTGRTVRLPL